MQRFAKVGVIDHGSVIRVASALLALDQVEIGHGETRFHRDPTATTANQKRLLPKRGRKKRGSGHRHLAVSIQNLIRRFHR